MPHSPRTICFVTGTRAEFGLMATTLAAIKSNKNLRLQIIATGMHLDRQHGDGIAAIRSAGFAIDAIVPWPPQRRKELAQRAQSVGSAIASLARAFEKLKTEIVVIVGDRVEAFAAASAAHLSGLIVAHIHGGDRAAGQVDDCLRHAITKLAHVHYPATKMSARRLLKMGEDAWRIRQFGSPGVDGIQKAAAPWNQIAKEFPCLSRRRFALIVHHPIDADVSVEAKRIGDLLNAFYQTSLDHAVIVYPNNDPGSEGIQSVLDKRSGDPRLIIRRDIPRNTFLGLMRDAAVMLGNSSSGIIEAGSFRTPVIDVGPRQKGRERGPDVFHTEYGRKKIAAALAALSDGDKFLRVQARNIYGGDGASEKIAADLAKFAIDPRLSRKLIAY